MRTLIIDGNFFGQRVLRALPDITFKVYPDEEKKEFLKACCNHLTNYLEQNKGIIENVVIVKDSRSWRRQVPIIRPNTTTPECDYKANRDERMEEEVVDMRIFFETLEEFFKTLHEKFNVPYTCVYGAEGDDAIWAWTKMLKGLNRHSMIYCTDSDMNQLVNSHTIIHRQVKTKEAQTGGEVIVDKSYWEDKNSIKEIDIFSDNTCFWGAEEELIGGRQLGKQIFIANPFWNVFKKMFTGDGKDNVPSAHIWNRIVKTTGATQTCKLTENMVEKAIEGVLVGPWETCEDFLYDTELHRDILICIAKMKGLDIDIEKSLAVVQNNRKLLYLNHKEIDENVVKDLVTNIKPQLDKYAQVSKLRSSTHILNAFGLSSVTYFENF